MKSLLLIVFTMFLFNGEHSQDFKQTKTITDSTQDTNVVVKKEFKLKHVKIQRKSNIAIDCNNPGCIRPGNKTLDTMAIGYTWTKNKSGKFLVFEIPQHGFVALQTLLKQRSNSTIASLITSYAPKCENNTNKYISSVCKKLKCTRNTKVGNVDIPQLSYIIAKLEGWKAN